MLENKSEHCHNVFLGSAKPCLKSECLISDALLEHGVVSDDNFKAMRTDSVCAIRVASKESEGIEKERSSYYCNFCPFVTEDHKEVLQHFWKHQFYCSDCDFKHFSRIVVLQHFRTSHPENVENISNVFYCSLIPITYLVKRKRILPKEFVSCSNRTEIGSQTLQEPAIKKPKTGEMNTVIALEDLPKDKVIAKILPEQQVACYIQKKKQKHSTKEIGKLSDETVIATLDNEVSSDPEQTAHEEILTAKKDDKMTNDPKQAAHQETVIVTLDREVTNDPELEETLTATNDNKVTIDSKQAAHEETVTATLDNEMTNAPERTAHEETLTAIIDKKLTNDHKQAANEVTFTAAMTNCPESDASVMNRILYEDTRSKVKDKQTLVEDKPTNQSSVVKMLDENTVDKVNENVSTDTIEKMKEGVIPKTLNGSKSVGKNLSKDSDSKPDKETHDKNTKCSAKKNSKKMMSLNEILIWKCSYCQFSSVSQDEITHHATRNHRGRPLKYVVTFAEESVPENVIKDLTDTESEPETSEEQENHLVLTNDAEEEATSVTDSNNSPVFKCSQCAFYSGKVQLVKEHMLKQHLGLCMFALDMGATEKHHVLFCLTEDCSFETREIDLMLKHAAACTWSSTDKFRDEKTRLKGISLRQLKKHDAKLSMGLIKGDSSKGMRVYYCCNHCSFISANVTGLPAIKCHVKKHHHGKKMTIQVFSVYKEVETYELLFCSNCFWDTPSKYELEKHMASKHKRLASKDLNTSPTSKSVSENLNSSNNKGDSDSTLADHENRDTDAKKSKTISDNSKANDDARNRDVGDDITASNYCGPTSCKKSRNQRLKKTKETDPPTAPVDLKKTGTREETSLIRYSAYVPWHILFEQIHLFLTQECKYNFTKEACYSMGISAIEYHIKSKGQTIPRFYECLTCTKQMFGILPLRRHLIKCHNWVPCQAMDVLNERKGSPKYVASFCPVWDCDFVTYTVKEILWHAKVMHSLGDENPDIKKFTSFFVTTEVNSIKRSNTSIKITAGKTSSNHCVVDESTNTSDTEKNTQPQTATLNKQQTSQPETTVNTQQASETTTIVPTKQTRQPSTQPATTVHSQQPLKPTTRRSSQLATAVQTQQASQPTTNICTKQTSQPTTSVTTKKTSQPTTTVLSHRASQQTSTTVNTRQTSQPSPESHTLQTSQPSTTANIQQASHPSTTANIQQTSQPSTTANIQQTSQPTTTANIHKTSQPTTTVNIQQASQPTTTVNIQQASQPTTIANNQQTPQPTTTVNIQQTPQPTTTANIQQISQQTTTALTPQTPGMITSFHTECISQQTKCTDSSTSSSMGNTQTSVVAKVKGKCQIAAGVASSLGKPVSVFSEATVSQNATTVPGQSLLHSTTNVHVQQVSQPTSSVSTLGSIQHARSPDNRVSVDCLDTSKNPLTSSSIQPSLFRVASGNKRFSLRVIGQVQSPNVVQPAGQNPAQLVQATASTGVMQYRLVPVNTLQPQLVSCPVTVSAQPGLKYVGKGSSRVGLNSSGTVLASLGSNTAGQVLSQLGSNTAGTVLSQLGSNTAGTVLAQLGSNTTRTVLAQLGSNTAGMGPSLLGSNSPGQPIARLGSNTAVQASAPLGSKTTGTDLASLSLNSPQRPIPQLAFNTTVQYHAQTIAQQALAKPVSNTVQPPHAQLGSNAIGTDLATFTPAGTLSTKLGSTSSEQVLVPLLSNVAGLVQAQEDSNSPGTVIDQLGSASASTGSTHTSGVIVKSTAHSGHGVKPVRLFRNQCDAYSHVKGNTQLGIRPEVPVLNQLLANPPATVDTYQDRNQGLKIVYVQDEGKIKDEPVDILKKESEADSLDMMGTQLDIKPEITVLSADVAVGTHQDLNPGDNSAANIDDQNEVKIKVESVDAEHDPVAAETNAIVKIENVEHPDDNVPARRNEECEPPVKYQCLYCSRLVVLRTLSKMKDHLSRAHNNDEFVFRDNVARRLNLPCRKYVCTESKCLFLTNIYENYNLHLQNHRNSAKM